MILQAKRFLQRIGQVIVACALAGGYGFGAWVAAAVGEPALKLYTDPEHADADFPFQGEYAGTVSKPDGGETRLGAQVRALGDGVFRTKKWLIGGATTRRKFQDFTLHVEFMISYVPQTRAIYGSATAATCGSWTAMRIGR